MKFFGWFFTKEWSIFLFDWWGQQKQISHFYKTNIKLSNFIIINYNYILIYIYIVKNLNKKWNNKLLFETPRDLQPIMCFNIITRSKRYSLFPILGSLIEPSFRYFRISLSNGLFSAVGIGRSIPFLRTVLESFLPHTAQQLISLVPRFNRSYLTNETSMDLSNFSGYPKEFNY